MTMRRFLGHIAVFYAYKFRHIEDAFGRTYRWTYRKYGHRSMLDEYLSTNTWGV